MKKKKIIEILAPSLATLRQHINNLYGNRDKRSDGWIGDRAHRRSKSDHNPNAAGVVQAIDIDKDLAPNLTIADIVKTLVGNRDPRIKYIIWRGQIVSSYPAHGYAAWQWRPYTGKNGHFEHVHISVSDDPDLYNDGREWDLADGPRTVFPDMIPIETPVVEDAPAPVVKKPKTEPGTTYKVKKDDNLTKIAATFKTSVRALKALNGIKDADKIKIGQTLVIR